MFHSIQKVCTPRQELSRLKCPRVMDRICNFFKIGEILLKFFLFFLSLFNLMAGAAGRVYKLGRKEQEN